MVLCVTEEVERLLPDTRYGSVVSAHSAAHETEVAGRCLRHGHVGTFYIPRWLHSAGCSFLLSPSVS